MTVDRVTKVVKGGRRLRFRALMVVGDGNGHVGVGLAKATGVPEAIRKAGAMGRKQLIEVPVVDETIPHETLAKYGASIVLLKPAAQGRGMIASKTIHTTSPVQPFSRSPLCVWRRRSHLKESRKRRLRRPAMRLNELSPVEGATHRSRRVGRGNGSGRGNFSGPALKARRRITRACVWALREANCLSSRSCRANAASPMSSRSNSMWSM